MFEPAGLHEGYPPLVTIRRVTDSKEEPYVHVLLPAVLCHRVVAAARKDEFFIANK
jgi:hypothetical protein